LAVDAALPKSPRPDGKRRGKRASATDSGGKPPHSTTALSGSGAIVIRVAHNIRIAGQVNRKQAGCKE
jgi:hypothetical protein